jgi:hypothetical protein
MMQDYLSKQDWSFIYNCKSIEISFSSFYIFMKDALDLFFPIKRITIKSRDPPYMTPYLKHLLRRKNHLHRHGRLAAAEALATRINHLIARNNETTFDCLARGSRRLWSEVRRLRGGARECPVLDSKITADSLNLHYSKTSTDQQYEMPTKKATVASDDAVFLEEYQVFRALSSARGVSVGPDGLPSWFLSSMAHLLSAPISYLFKKSLLESYIPPQWKESKITPIPKTPNPNSEADFRPISITSVLCKILEKFVVHKYYYPILTDPDENYIYSDQFAFRPSGSTSAALIALTHHLLESVKCEPYVRLVSLDFSKAFDTVRHNSLALQLASMPIPDFVYNWVLALLQNRVHCTKFCGIISS